MNRQHCKQTLRSAVSACTLLFARTRLSLAAGLVARANSMVVQQTNNIPANKSKKKLLDNEDKGKGDQPAVELNPSSP